MKFSSPLIEGRLIKRYKRFLADVRLNNGETVTAHTANTGAMTGCAEPGSRVWLSRSNNAKRKYPLTWELVEVNSSRPTLLGINTQLSNALVAEAIGNGVAAELQHYTTIRREVRYGVENSRIDLLLQQDSSPPCYVEVKNVTLVEGGAGYFPDAVTTRGSKHLRELAGMAAQGCRSVIFYCVQREDVSEVRPAQHIDASYAATLRQVVEQGVEALAYRAMVSPREIVLTKKVPVML
jgi:sugar fermentation stimulation protein A